MTEAQVIQSSKEQRKKQAELELLLDDDEAGTKVADKKPSQDARFTKLAADAEFAIDPTHKEFRKVTQGHNKVVKKHKRR